MRWYLYLDRLLMDAISRSVLDIYWGYLLDKILCKAGVSIHSWVCEGLAVWQYLGSFPSHSSHLSQQTISSGDNCHHPWLPLITSLPIIPDVMRWWEARGGVRDIISYLEECQVSSQIAVITYSLIQTDFTQLGLHVDMTGRTRWFQTSHQTQSA